MNVAPVYGSKRQYLPISHMRAYFSPESHSVDKHFLLTKLKLILSTDLDDDFAYDQDPASTDFNREIIHPGTFERYPDGAIAIRVDGDFFIAAIYPYEFIDISLPDIAALLWPSHVAQATFGADTIYGTTEEF